MKPTDRSKRKSLKQAWPLLVTVLAIVLSSVMLVSAIGAGHSRALEEVVTKAFSESEAPPNIDSIAPEEEETASPETSEEEESGAAASAKPELEIPTDYSISLMPDSEQPPDSAINAEKAAALAVEYLYMITGGVDFNNVLALYGEYEGIVNGLYSLYIGDGPVVVPIEDDPQAPFAASSGFVFSGGVHELTIDAITGELQAYGYLPDSSEYGKGDDFDDVDDALMEELRDDPAFEEKARQIISDHFLDGREIVEVMIDGIQWVFDNKTYDIQVDAKVNVDTGTCYTINFSYPGYNVVGFTAFPLGWHSALYGYWNPEEAEMYSDYGEEWTSGEGVTEAPLEEPAPVPPNQAENAEIVDDITDDYPADAPAPVEPEPASEPAPAE